MNIPAPSSIQSLTVGLGKPLPSATSDNIPMLAADEPAQEKGLLQSRHSQLEDGMRFEGKAVIADSFSVGGEFEGSITPSGVRSSVVVSETGRIKGDVCAQKISVLGYTDGKLDAGAGEVALHDSATVMGSVRYGRIQVNGANLNATLERVTSN
jgi:cytoskeletal protein CcmA (bactofilin family)